MSLGGVCVGEDYEGPGLQGVGDPALAPLDDPVAAVLDLISPTHSHSGPQKQTGTKCPTQRPYLVDMVLFSEGSLFPLLG